MSAPLSPVVVDYLQALTIHLLWMSLLGGVIGGMAYCIIRDVLRKIIDWMPTPLSDRLIERARKYREFRAAADKGAGRV
jgi:hypothetical protein